MVQDNDNKSVRNMMNETLINENNLRLANEKAIDLTIRKLTYINPIIQQMFAEEHERAKREERATE